MNTSKTQPRESPDNRAILETIHKNAPDEEREWTPMEDARLMIDLWDTCITKKIIIERGSPLHRLVKMTLQRLRQNVKASDLSDNSHSKVPGRDDGRGIEPDAAGKARWAKPLKQDYECQSNIR